MKYQYETLLVELQRYSETLATRKHAIAITKIDSLSLDEVNALTETFLADIGLEANKTLNQYKAKEEYISYGFEQDFGVKLPEEKPLFVLPISSVAHLNTEVLRYALGDFVKNVKEEQEAEEK
jgi:GTP-binding protein